MALLTDTVRFDKYPRCMCVAVNVSEEISAGKLQISEYRDPKNKHGALGADKIKTKKYKN